MGRIPTITSNVSARSGRTAAGVPSPTASPEAFGAAGGRALQQLGQGAQQLAGGLDAVRDQKRKEEAANAVAQSDFTRRELELRNEAGPSADGYQERALEEYDAWVDEQSNGIEDDRTRQIFRERMAAQRLQVSQRSAQYEFSTAAEHSKNEANTSLVALDNKIRLQPQGYDDFIEQGFEVIDSRPGLTATAKSTMKTVWSQNAALSRFEGMLEGASTVEDVQAIEDELSGKTGREWSSEFSQAGLERTLALASSAKKSIMTQADAEARAAIDTLEGRASDVTTLISKEELAAAQQVVDRSSNSVTAARMARVVRDQSIIREARRLTPAQQRETINQRYRNPSLPNAVNGAITQASQKFGVSSAYLAATVKREYGVFLKGEDTDYTQGAIGGTSSALGPMQFIESTFLNVMSDPAVQAAAGVDTTGMSREQVLALRGNPFVAVMAGAALTQQNAKALQSVTGRPPTDAELYMAHFLGGEGAARLLRMVRANPDVLASDMMPKAAAANKSVFFKKDGTARTVVELYNELGRKHGTEGAETYVEYGDRETREKALADTESRLANDPMAFAQQVGIVTGTDIFSEGGMAQRGDQARSVAEYYQISATDMKPFTEDEVATLGKRLAEGSADEVLNILASTQQMGGQIARAAMNQLGKVDDVYAFAGGLGLETGQSAAAADVVRGQKRLQENPDIERQIGTDRQGLSDAFSTATGGALLDASPGQREAIKNAAIAHYVETQVARGRAGVFDQGTFEQSVNAVLGGNPVDDVNGQKTVLPAGVTGSEMEDALQAMTISDFAAMSRTGKPPRYVTGAIAAPEDIADEAQLRAIGGGQYRVMMDDGSFLVTGDVTSEGRMEAYIFVPDVARVKQIASQGTSTSPTPTPPEEPGTPGRGLAEGDPLPPTGPGAGLPSITGDIDADIASAQSGGLTHEGYRALITKYGADAIMEWVDQNQ